MFLFQGSALELRAKSLVKPGLCFRFIGTGAAIRLAARSAKGLTTGHFLEPSELDIHKAGVIIPAFVIITSVV